MSSYLIHSRTVQVGRPHGIEAATPRVAESTGKNLRLVVVRHAVDVEPDDFAKKRGARFASCSATVPRGEVEMPIIVTRTEEDLGAMAKILLVSVILMNLKQQIKGNNKHIHLDLRNNLDL